MLCVTKKLTREDFGLFYVFGKSGRLAYRLEISKDEKIHLLFLVTKLNLVPSSSNEVFGKKETNLTLVFIHKDIKTKRFFKIVRLLNK